MAAFHFKSHLVTCQHLRIETLSNDAMNSPYTDDNVSKK
jgi:hypothetical protein